MDSVSWSQNWFSQQDGTPGLWLAVLYWMQCSMFRLFMRKRGVKFTPFSGIMKQITVLSSVALYQSLYSNSVQHATTPGFQPAEKTSFVTTNAISEREGGGLEEVFGKRIADLSIYLPCRSVFWRIVFDWLPSDTKRVLSCEMHQDFGANTRVPPKSASGRLENASSALSLPNTSSDPPPSLSVHYLCIQSVLTQQNPNSYSKTT